TYEAGTGWTRYTQADGLGDNDLTAVAMGYDDAVWFATERSGVCSYGEPGVATPTPTSTPTQPPVIPATSPFGVGLIILLVSILLIPTRYKSISGSKRS
ncbi:hypothetical protein K8T06_10235, partial [bacterium]|nr:hypothetical protein [bacterium]